MSDTLATLLVELGCDPSALKAGFRRAVADARSAGDAAGSAFGVGFKTPVMNAVAGVGDLLVGTRELLRFAGAASGSKVAAEFGEYRRQLAYISGDANKAERAFKSLQNTAKKSNFDTGEVAQFGVSLAGRYGDVDRAAREVQQTTDAAQVSGVQNSNFGAFQTNMRDIQNKGDRQVERPDLEQLRRYAPTLTAAMAKSYGISVAEASKKIENATGNELANMILGLGQRNKGAAEAASGSDPYKVAANALDTLNSAIEPTGRIVNESLLPVAQNMLWLAQQFGRLNDVTGGSAGIVGVVSLTAVGIKRFGSVLVTTGGIVNKSVGAVERLTVAVEGLAIAANTAESAERRESAAKLGAGGSGVAGFGAGVAGAVPFILPPIISMTAGYLAHKREANAKEGAKGDKQRIEAARLRGVGLGAEIGGTALGITGGLLGSVVPGVGNVAGAVGGTALGVLIGGGIGGKIAEASAKASLKKNSAVTAQKEAADAANKLANALEKTRFNVIGGGSRARDATGVLAAEYAMARTFRTGIA